MKLTIGHLFPDLLNLYGDRGNIQCMVQRLKWRGIDSEVKTYSLEDNIDFENIVGTIAGDDTIFVLCRNLKATEEMLNKFRKLI